QLERPESEQLVANLFDQLLTLGHRERSLLCGEDLLGEAHDLRVGLPGREQIELGQIHAVNQRAMKPRLHFVKAIYPIRRSSAVLTANGGCAVCVKISG